MTATERAKFIDDFYHQHCVKIMGTKGLEYSQHEEDVNSNFKRLGAELNLDPQKVLFVYLKKHLDAITSYIKTGKVESEAIELRIADAINYMFILGSLITEETKINARGKKNFQKDTEYVACPIKDPKTNIRCKGPEYHDGLHSWE